MSERVRIDPIAVDEESLFFQSPIPSLVKRVTMKRVGRGGGWGLRIHLYSTCKEKTPLTGEVGSS